MALEFELKLIRLDESYAIFCRGTLESTHYLIKHTEPEIAAAITQVLAQPPLPINEEYNNDPYMQCFYVDVDPNHVTVIVEMLQQIIDNQDNDHSSGYIEMAHTLYENWIELARALA